MRKALLWMLAVTSTCFSLSTHKHLHEKAVTDKDSDRIIKIIAMISPELISPQTTNKTMAEIANMLMASTLNTPVIEKVLKTLKCANEYNVIHNNILTIIDYSLPSSEKRLWVFDLYEKNCCSIPMSRTVLNREPYYQQVSQTNTTANQAVSECTKLKILTTAAMVFL